MGLPLDSDWVDKPPFINLRRFCLLACAFYLRLSLVDHWRFIRTLPHFYSFQKPIQDLKLTLPSPGSKFLTNEEVSFSAVVSPEDSADFYEWDFGDNQPQQTKAPFITHKFSNDEKLVQWGHVRLPDWCVRGWASVVVWGGGGRGGKLRPLAKSLKWQ